MKSRVFAILGSLTLLTAAAALAQSELVLRADIPFDFRVGTAMLPAGQYDVRPQTVGGVMLIRRVDGSAAAMTLTNGARARKTPGPGTLVFNRYGNTYFLGEVWNPGSSEGCQVIKSKAEREFARNKSPIPHVEVAVAK
jgi:hypothetical protein